LRSQTLGERKEDCVVVAAACSRSQPERMQSERSRLSTLTTRDWQRNCREEFDCLVTPAGVKAAASHGLEN
jgi:predicted alpha/beta hydrolase